MHSSTKLAMSRYPIAEKLTSPLYYFLTFSSNGDVAELVDASAAADDGNFVEVRSAVTHFARKSSDITCFYREVSGEMIRWIIARTLNRFGTCFKYVSVGPAECRCGT